jgi:hypothetical protein
MTGRWSPELHHATQDCVYVAARPAPRRRAWARGLRPAAPHPSCVPKVQGRRLDLARLPQEERTAMLQMRTARGDPNAAVTSGWWRTRRRAGGLGRGRGAEARKSLRGSLVPRWVGRGRAPKVTGLGALERLEHSAKHQRRSCRTVPFASHEPFSPRPARTILVAAAGVTRARTLPAGAEPWTVGSMAVARDNGVWFVMQSAFFLAVLAPPSSIGTGGPRPLACWGSGWHGAALDMPSPGIGRVIRRGRHRPWTAPDR